MGRISAERQASNVRVAAVETGLAEAIEAAHEQHANALTVEEVVAALAGVTARWANVLRRGEDGPKDPPDGHLTTAEAAAHLGVTPPTFRNLAAGRDDFPRPAYVGRTPLWPIAGLDAWREQHPARPKKAGAGAVRR